MSTHTIKCGNIEAKPGERKYGYLHVGYMAANTEARIPVQVLNGAHDGPVLCLESTLHGWEPVGAEILRRAMLKVDPNELAGAVLVLPLAHPFSVEFGGSIEGAGLRVSPVDMLNLNRVWPGKSTGASLPSPTGWLTEQMAHVMWTNVLEQADYLLDFHDGTGSCDELPVAFPSTYPEGEPGCLPDLNERVLDLAKAFGAPVTWLHDTKSINSTMITGAFAKKGGVPLVVEAGGDCALDYTVDMCVDNVLNVMKHLKMIDGEPVYAPPQIIVDNYAILRSPAGGYYIPEPEIKLGAKVTKGQLLGRVIDPLTSEVRVEPKSPVNGIVISRRVKLPLNPGSYIAHIADTDSIIWQRD